MKILVLIFLFACAAYSQPTSPDNVQKEIPKCQHDDEDDFYANLQHSGPVRLLMIDGRTLTVSRTTRFKISHQTYTMDNANVRLPKDVYKISKSKLYFLLFCRVHLQVFVIEEVLKK